MKDYLGNDLDVGDIVIYFEEHYRVFTTGFIRKINAVKLTLEEINPRHPYWKRKAFREPQCVIKKNKL